MQKKTYFAEFPNKENLVRYIVEIPNYVRYNLQEAGLVKSTLEQLADGMGLELIDRFEEYRNLPNYEEHLERDLDLAGPYYLLRGITKKATFEKAFGAKLKSVQKEDRYYIGDEFGATPTHYWMKVQEWNVVEEPQIPESLNLKVKCVKVMEHMENFNMFEQDDIMDKYKRNKRRVILK